MTLSARTLNRATLARQLLLEREAIPVAEAVRRVMAVQAQQPASPYLALWNRVRDLDPRELDEAFTSRRVVKATVLRITLHAMHADDYEPFRRAMEPTLRSALYDDSRYTVSGLTPEEGDALIPDLVSYAAQPRTTQEIQAWLDQRHGRRLAPGAWRAFRGYAPLLHAPTGPPWSFAQRPSYVAADALPLRADPDTAAVALKAVVRRYLAAFGPASMPDAAQFLLVQRSRVKRALAEMADELEQLEGEDGTRLHDVPDGPRPAADTPAPARLMAMWDSTLLANSDRSRILPADLRRVVTRTNGDVLPTLLVDGYVVGVWRTTENGIEARSFRPLSRKDWADLTAEAERLVAFLADRDPLVYRRYDHWWRRLPDGQTRVLAGW